MQPAGVVDIGEEGKEKGGQERERGDGEERENGRDEEAQIGKGVNRTRIRREETRDRHTHTLRDLKTQNQRASERASRSPPPPLPPPSPPRKNLRSMNK